MILLSSCPEMGNLGKVVLCFFFAVKKRQLIFGEVVVYCKFSVREEHSYLVNEVPAI